MVKSPDGYLWLSAVNGVIRFDGIRFTFIDGNTTPALRTTLAGEYVPSLVDPSGTMWLRGPGGALVTYRAGVFVRVRDGSEGAEGVLSQDARGLLWVASRRLFRIHDGALVDPGLPSEAPDTGIFGVVRDTGSGLWIGTETQGLWHVSGAGVRRHGTGRLRALLHASDGSVWALGVGMGLGIWRLKDSTWTRATLQGSPDDRLISRIAVEDDEGNVWFQTPAMGLLRWRDGWMERFTTTEGLSSNRVHDVMVDGAGAVWASTDAGIDRLRPSAFNAVSPFNDLPYDTGYEFEQDAGGGLWGAASESRLLYLLDGGAIRRQPGSIHWKTFEVDSGRPFRILRASHRGGVWVGPRSGGLVLQRLYGRQWWSRRHGLPVEPLVKAVESADGTLWLIDSAGGFGRFRDGRYVAVPLDRIDRPRVRLMTADGVGLLWVWPEGSPDVLVMEGDSVIGRRRLPSDTHESIGDLAAEGSHAVWATTSRSVVRLTRAGVAEVPLPSLAGILSAPATLAITGDHLWLANAIGIARIALTDLHHAAEGNNAPIVPHVLDDLDGLPFPRTPSTTPGSIRAGLDGRLWLVTPSGIFVSDVTPPARDAAPPVVHIEELLVSGQVLPRTDSYSIAPNPERLTIRFSAPNLVLPERMRVEYRLDGADTKWLAAPPERAVTYTPLRPGAYRFRVRAWSDEGSAGARDASVVFLVRPAWYQSWWFTSAGVLAGLAVSAAGGAGWLRRRNRLNHERLQARFEAVLAERARIARELHDTLLQGFTGITLHLEGLRSTVGSQSIKAANELAVILRTADNTLREAREMVWDMRSPQLDTADLVTTLESSSRHLINGDDVTVTFRARGTPRHLPASVQTTALRVGREALFNAIKHAQPRSIDVVVTYHPRQLVLEVMDDGRGADPHVLGEAERSGHFGIAGIRERAQRSGGDVSIVTSPGRGMTVRLTVPAEPID
jgi:signal transduction histidine kinase/ligand-binding sensor domain-containing protein